ncbi:hypothetical protein [Garciella nitratireducens]|uniref:hypothetical protein n=1 Tax=Garciella nitratireducens TaxID=218205 RepID=UPI000DE99A58|nr:hypothetical protein [Garciella nitratireducens]RBP42209.1 hypothetical protein DFR81_1096 [Garciella nitratireducens]
MKQQIINHIEEIKEDLFSLSSNLYQGNFKKDVIGISEYLLKRQGFECSRVPFGDFFIIKGEKKGGKGPTIAFFYYYTFEPELKEEWNIRMATPMSIGAALGLASVLEELGGNIVIFGCPWNQENLLIEQNLLNGIDGAILLKSGSQSCESGCSVNIHHMQVDFHGKKSINGQYTNALHGVIQCFNGIFTLKESLPSSIQLEGIITEGGKIPEEIPIKASATFSISCPHKDTLNEIITDLENCAKGAALQTGTEVIIHYEESHYDCFNTNVSLNRLFCHNLKEVGLIDIHGPEENEVTLKAGNISHQVPSICPCVGIGQDQELSSEVQENILKGSQAAAFTAFDMISNQNLFKEIKKEFKKNQ